jgi:hypothetical protein
MNAEDDLEARFPDPYRSNVFFVTVFSNPRMSLKGAKVRRTVEGPFGF